MTALTAARASGRSLLPVALFDRLVARIVRDERMERELAERIMDQALAFLGACAITPRPLSPSEMVDIGWHTFILHTREYEQFCQRVASRFIHHEPTDASGHIAGRPSAPFDATIDALRAAGFGVDTDLWLPAETDNCSQCHNGCSDDPPPMLNPVT